MSRMTVLLPMILLACGETDKGTGDTAATTADGGGGQGCSPTIPADAEVVHASLTINASDEAAWACAGSSISVNASGATLFLEAGATASVNGSAATVYAKSGSTVVINASDATVYAEDGASITVNAASAARQECDSLVFDDAAVPSGC